MCKVQVRAKRERQNDDYATTSTNPNSSSLNDKAHHVRRRLSQTISSRHCLLIAIALASLSAHACSDTVELQVTCDSGKTPWFVPSSNAIYENTTVTVGSCIAGHVEYVAQVKGKDIDANTNGIVICSQSDVDVCYHLKRQSGGQIEAKKCGNDGYGDPICRYYCDNGVLKFRNDTNPESTPSDTCFSANNESHNYECDGNIVRKTPCLNGCADDHKGCKQSPDQTDKCTANDTPICEGGALFECINSTYIKVGKACNDKGEVVFCNGNDVKSAKHTCANDKVVFCDEKNNVNPEEMYTCEGDQVVWCKPNEQNPLQTTACFPSSQNDSFIACKDLNKTRLSCDENGKILPEESCSTVQTKCTGNLKGRVDCNGIIIDACQYCYTESIENNFTSVRDLGCEGCVPNEYNFGDSSESLFNTMNSICHNGKESKFGNIENRNFLFIPEFNKDGFWEFALNVTPALSKNLSVVPANDQSKQTWQYYNCYNDTAMEFLKKFTDIDDADKFVKTLNELRNTTGENAIDSIVPKTCCDDDSYYITQTGYRYYSVEKCTNIVLYDTHDINNGKSKLTNFSAYAYTPELNGSIIGIEDDLLAKDYACLEAKDKPKDKKAVRRMFIKQKTNGEQQSKDGEPKHGIYKAFECPEDYKCDLKNRYKGLCISENENVPSNSNCSCNNNNTIMCGSVIIAACPKGTTPRIVGDSDQTSCDGQIFSLDQIRCVPDGKSTAKQ